MIPRIAKLLILVPPLVLPACHRPAPQTAEHGSLPTATVVVESVRSTPRIETEAVLGTVRPAVAATVESKVGGTISAIYAVPGQSVKAGDLLVEIDAKEFQTRLDQASTRLGLARTEFNRYRTLLEKQAATRQEFDRASTDLEVALSAQAEAGTMLGYTKIVAPFDGTVSRKRADVGDLAVPGKPLIEIENATGFRIEALVPASLIDRVHIGDRIGVTIGDGSEPVHSNVVEISPAADAASRTFLVKLDLPADAGAKAGQFGRASIPVKESQIIEAPASAVFRRGQLELAIVADGSKARMRIVKTGRRFGDTVEILSGIDDGEAVVVDNPVRIVDGQPIEVKP